MVLLYGSETRVGQKEDIHRLDQTEIMVRYMQCKVKTPEQHQEDSLVLNVSPSEVMHRGRL